MNSRERVAATLAHREPDRIPVDLGASESSGIHGIAYNRLKTHLGLAGGSTRLYDLSQMIAKVEPAVLDAVGADAVPLLIEPRRWKPWTLMDGKPLRGPRRRASCARPPAATGSCSPPTALWSPSARSAPSTSTPATTPSRRPPRRRTSRPAWSTCGASTGPPATTEDYDDLRRKARDLHESTDRAIVGNLWVHVFAAGQTLRGFETFMVDLLADKRLAHALMGRLVDCYEERVRRVPRGRRRVLHRDPGQRRPRYPDRAATVRRPRTVRWSSPITRGSGS